MPLPDDGVCAPWATWAQVTACCKADVEAAITDPVDQLRHLTMATEILYGLTGRQYPGLCSATRSFCAPARCCSGGPSCWSRCRCGPDSRIDLAGGDWDVAAVSEVVVDGVALVEGTDYRVDDHRWLVRLGDERWPNVVDLTDPEALEVTWIYGRMPPDGGAYAAASLACELAAACIPGAACNLPTRVTGVTAEGVTYSLVDPTKIVNQGYTGLYVVDLWLRSVTKPPEMVPSGGFFDPGACAKARAVDTGASAT